MKTTLPLILLLCLFAGCITPNHKYFAGMLNSTDQTYGYTMENPVLIKNADLDHSIGSSYYYLQHLRSGKGNKLVLLKRSAVFNPAYKKPGVELVNRYTGMPINSESPVIDLYFLKAEYEPDTVKIYINPYKKGKVSIPVGLTFEE